MRTKTTVYCISLAFIFFLSGCSSSGINSDEYGKVQSEFLVENDTINQKDKELAELESAKSDLTVETTNDDFLDMSSVDNDISSLPSGNEYLENPEFRQCLAEALAELGSSFEINGIDIYIEDELDGDITLIVYVDTDIRPIAVYTHYLGLVDSWIYSVIRDANLDHVYYPSLYKTHDFYTDAPINN